MEDDSIILIPPAHPFIVNIYYTHTLIPISFTQSQTMSSNSNTEAFKDGMKQEYNRVSLLTFLAIKN